MRRRSVGRRVWLQLVGRCRGWRIGVVSAGLRPADECRMSKCSS